MAERSVFVYLFILTIKYVNSDVLCEEGFCRSHILENPCATPAEHCHINNATHHGLKLPSPTICNCCEFCLPLFNENHHCSSGGPGTGTTVGRCGHGLNCTEGSEGFSCQRMQSTCHSAQDDYDRRHENGQTGSLERRAECDNKGRYAVFDCIATQTCFCQSEEGERIFGEALYVGTFTSRNMHCGCSRVHEKIKNNISPGVSYPVTGPRCTSDGNFNPVQCLGRTCYCVNEVTGVAQGDDVINLDEDPITSLPCYNAALDLFPENEERGPPYNYTSPCLLEQEERIKLLQDFEEQGFDVSFYSTVRECLPDGTYGRIATTRNGTKICVDERGLHVKDYEAQPNTPEYNSMDCKCAETSLFLKNSTEKPVCCKNGNFRKIQCRRGLCRCVDSDGRQIGLELADVTRLSCFTPDWRNC